MRGQKLIAVSMCDVGLGEDGDGDGWSMRVTSVQHIVAVMQMRWCVVLGVARRRQRIGTAK